MCCNLCGRWMHQSCAGFNQTEYKTLTKKSKYQDNLMWFCNGCFPTVPCFLEGRDPATSPSRSSKPSTNDITELNKKLDVVQGCQLVWIFRISYGKSVQIRKYDLCHSEYGLRKKKTKTKTKRLQKEIMTSADKLIGGNSNITLYYFHGRANVVNLM